MPASKISLDIDTRKLLSAAQVAISSLSIKNGNIVDYELAITQNGVALSLPSGSTVEVAMKIPTNPAGTLIYHADADRSGWGTGSRWFFTLDLSDPAFGGPLVLGKQLDFEILITTPAPDEQRLASLTTPLLVLKNVMT